MCFTDGKEKVILNTIDVDAKQNMNFMMKEFKKICKDKSSAEFIKLSLLALNDNNALKKLDNLLEGMKLTRGIKD